MIIRKSIYFFIITLGICLLCGCAKNEGSINNEESINNEINEKAEIDILLQGTWNVKVGDSINAIFSFQNGSVSCQTEVLGVSLEANEGKYEIGETEILITYDSGIDAELEYSYEDGSLIVYFDDEVMQKM